jgi:maltose alpha-D-glucosyltransferase/alpha-amylase
LVVRRGVDEALAAPGRAILERETLPNYVAKRRWFSAKGEHLESIRIAYAAPIEGTPDVLLAEISATVGGRTENYVLPLGIAWEEETTGALAQQLALARVRRGRRVGVLTDGFAIDAFVTRITAMLRRGARIEVPGGQICFLPTPRLADLEVPDHAEIRRLSAEQTNSSLILGDAMVLKIVRHVAAGIHPEAEMTRVLTERGYTNSAPLLGEVVRVDTDGTPRTLMLAQGFVRNQGDGWGWTLDFLARVVEEIAITGHEDEAEADALATYATFATAMGRRLAELHAVLAQPTDDPDFHPEEADATILREWADGVVEQIDLTMEILRTRTDWPDDTVRERAAGVVGHADALRAAAQRLSSAGTGALRMRVHGDFHLGQVLVVQNDAFIIDFEGEPARSLEQRRQKSSPIRDVAGLLRSFDYVAAAAAPGRVAASPGTEERRAILLERFRLAAGQRFLEAYRAVLEAAPVPWVPAGAVSPLIDLFLLEKAAYEVRYEASNRPTWIGIPLRGLAEIADRILVPEPAE